MKRKYETPAMQEHVVNIATHLLIGSNIGEGGAGQEGDVKGFIPLGDSESESIFEDNPFE